MESQKPSPRRQSTGKARARYGTKATNSNAQSSNNIAGKAAVLVIIAILVVAGVFYFQQHRTASNNTVTASERGFETDSDSQLTLYMDVTRSTPSMDSYCVVRALDYDKTEVGRREILIPAGENSTVKLSVPISTRKRAVAGDVYGCGTTIPSYLKS